MNFLNFLKYNNAVPIIMGVILLGGGSAFAATDPSAIYSQQQQVLTVDNTYIANKDLSTWTPQITITGVTEDPATYHVAYDFETIDVDNYVWKDVTKKEVIDVPKAALGGKDLGLYVTAQFKNIIANELAYLNQVQAKARQNTTQETVATTYGGLVGKVLTDTTQTLPGYTPVVQPPPPPTDNSSQAAAVAAAGGSASQGAQSGGSSAPAVAPANSASNPSALSIQILGNNPAYLDIGAGYIDLGAFVTDPNDPNIGYSIFVDGKEEPVV